MTRYSKAIFAVIAALATWGVAAAADGVYDQIELWALLGVVGTAAGVYLIPNTPPVGEPRDPEISETAPSPGPVLLASPAPKKASPAKRAAKRR